MKYYVTYDYEVTKGRVDQENMMRFRINQENGTNQESELNKRMELTKGIKHERGTTQGVEFTKRRNSYPLPNVVIPNHNLQNKFIRTAYEIGFIWEFNIIFCLRH